MVIKNYFQKEVTKQYKRKKITSKQFSKKICYLENYFENTYFKLGKLLIKKTRILTAFSV